MKSYRKELHFNIPNRRGIVNITPEIQQTINESCIQEGLVLINPMHITASVFINDDESGLHHDYEVWLEKLAPEKPHDQYRHNGFEADAHLKRTIMGRESTAVAQRTVRTIPVTKNIFTMHTIIEEIKRRVAAYARVSTKAEEQASSYEAQVAHYTNYIKSKPEWEFVKVYTDKESATNTKKREGFNQMIKDALDGKISLIIAKSVQRFARNTVDSLVTIRKLKEKGVEIYFELE